ncbi:squamosa promoter-binding-like protein 7 isoform X2 [Senna tora]|uniref:Squamosa promoter-binding-like protein 7 isoform X2 n=1 Tax=Senna tora TaxID=362788 RepID=A0A835CBG0_9FABA|nr:squamosa promoter-binding-like protein 7 isoform X2 [Senna tora]
MEIQASSTPILPEQPRSSSSSSPPPPPSALPGHRSGVSEMDVQQRLPEDISSVWDLDCLLDFSLDDQLNLALDDYPPNSEEVFEPLGLPPQENPNSDKVRKRDPRLTCSNFIAGRVPCACPELDAKLEEEGLPGKKRARTVRASAGIARCQVPGCEADISELKGYHRRHRVCLRCANASTVMLDGEAKRYCQQCGKFHILSDFDEGKRSCRRKLERHNRRRRKPTDSRAAEDQEVQPVTQTEEEAGKDSSHLSSEINEIGAALDHEDQQTPDTLNVNCDSLVSFAACGEAQLNGGKDNSNISNSPSYCDNKSAYSSMCPTGRISFKLYDWNPAEFPRRLRHQIFQWLASMPVELEGYIRPGCTILTLLEDPLYYVHDLVAPGKILSGRGTILVHLNDSIFHVMKDTTSVMEVQIKVQAPRLHYVHPMYFEAGKPMEFFACGSNLLQPKFRLLVSFSGKYLKYDYCVASPHNWTGDGISCAFDNQLYKIYVPCTEPNLFGPAFIEVENESGLSNFIPVLIGDKEICSEVEILQQKLDVSLLSKQSQSASGSSICSFCEAFALRHPAYSDLLMSEIDMTLLRKHMYQARDFLYQKHQSCEDSAAHSVFSEMEGHKVAQSYYQDNTSIVAINSQGCESRENGKRLEVLRNPACNDKSERMPLLKREIIMNVEEFPRRPGYRYLARGFLSSRPAILMIASVAICVGVCAVLLHPGRVGEFAVSIRRCLFSNS